MKKWTPDTWKNFPAKHLPVYQDEAELNSILKNINKLPPLVFAGESRSLKKELAKVVAGKAFLL